MGIRVWSLGLLLVGQSVVLGQGAGDPDGRITQSQIESGALTLDEIRRSGLEVFCEPFDLADGFGDGPMNPLNPVSPGGRPTTTGTWLRINGLDSQSCLECHSLVSNATNPATMGIGGAGALNALAFPGVTEIDLEDENGTQYAEVNGRLINPPFLFGAGGVELVAKQMTQDLQRLKEEARANPGQVVGLVVQGVDFGTISYDSGAGAFVTSGVVGIDPDLVVRPFGRKGDNGTVREFASNAMQFHQGMQPVEVVGADVDSDGDGVANEILIGELSALHVFAASLERPRLEGAARPRNLQGLRVFRRVGCADCHRPNLQTTTTKLGLAFPEVPEDPSANVYYTIDLEKGAAGFPANKRGGVRVPLFSDLKRHDMGPELAETTGDPLDPWFITPRLWGVADTAPYLHDGRALTLEDAIRRHGGEGAPAAAAFDALGRAERQLLLEFLDSLRTPTHPARGISQPRRR